MRTRKYKKMMSVLSIISAFVITLSGLNLNSRAFDATKIISDFNYLREYISYRNETDPTEKEAKKARIDDHYVNLITKMVQSKASGGELTLSNAYNKFQMSRKTTPRIIDETKRTNVLGSLGTLEETVVSALDEAIGSNIASPRRNTFQRRRNQIVGISGASGGGGEPAGPEGSGSGPTGSLEGSPIDLGTGYQFLGAVTTTELFGSGQTILNHFSPTGTDFNTETDYLKFKRDSDDVILLVAQKTVKHTITWDSINGGSSTQDTNDVNSGVYGAMQKTINGETYKIRLLTGGNANPATGAGGEWDDLIVGLNVLNSSTYNDAYFGTGSGNGRASWAQEQYDSNSSYRVQRGDHGISQFSQSYWWLDSYALGWRPVLELVQSPGEGSEPAGPEGGAGDTGEAGPSTGPTGSLEASPVDLGTGYQFLGAVTTTELFGSGQTILNHFDPTGTNFNTTTDYLKFKRDSDDAIILVAQKPVKHSISWNAINGDSSTQDPSNVNSGVYGAMQKTINGDTYKIRLLTGGNSNPATGAGGEWDDLLVSLNTMDSVTYSDSYFGTGSGDARASWAQEEGFYDQWAPEPRVARGFYGVSYIHSGNVDTGASDTGWRPALELVQ